MKRGRFLKSSLIFSFPLVAWELIGIELARGKEAVVP